MLERTIIETEAHRHDFNYVYFTDGANYNVVLPADADFEVDGATVYFETSDAAHVGRSWRADRHGMGTRHGIHFTTFGASMNQSDAEAAARGL